MVDVRKEFPNQFEDEICPCFNSDYDALVSKFGEVLISCDIGTYQGDTLVVLKKDDKYGYLQFGWGSCSYCDALQGCKNYEDLQELVDYLESSIKWFDSKEELKSWGEEHDWVGDWFWDGNELKVWNFVYAVNKL